MFSIVPDKAAIYPEYVGRLPRDHGKDCGESLYDLFVEMCRQSRVDWFVRLDDLLTAARRRGVPPYDKTGAVWNREGARIAAEALLKAAFKDQPPVAPEDDLNAMVIGPPRGVAKHSDDSRPQLSSAVVYGGLAVSELLPGLSRPFMRTDAIYTNTIPSPNHGEDLASYDVIMIVIDLSQLADLQLDPDRLCRMLDAETLAQHTDPVPLQTVSAKTRLSLRPVEKGILEL